MTSIERLKEYGYNPIHLFGRLYLVRHWSKRYTKVSWYDFHIDKG